MQTRPSSVFSASVLTCISQALRNVRSESREKKGIQAVTQFFLNTDECPKTKDGDELSVASTSKSETTADLQSDKNDPGSSSGS